MRRQIPSLGGLLLPSLCHIAPALGAEDRPSAVPIKRICLIRFSNTDI
jgi:hypothetical protein